MTRTHYVLIALTLLLPSLVNAQAPQMHPDYPNVRAELVGPILAMESGVHDGATKLPWRLYVPHDASSEKKLPLVVVLHGAGSRGEDNVRPMALFKSFWDPQIQKKHPAFILAPQMKHGWVAKPGGFTNYSADEIPPSKDMQTMLQLVERTLKQQPIDPDRVYVVGMSMGGYGAWDAITRRPDLWAAAVPICGGGDPSKAMSFKHIPIWAWHGSKDPTVPVENTRAMIEALKQAGAQPHYSEIRDGWHGTWDNAFKEPKLYDWLFAQRRSDPAAQHTTGMNEGETVADAAVPQNPAMRPAQDVPGLPRVLLLGDSISIAYTEPVRALLEGKAQVHRPPVNCQSSRTGVAGTTGDRSWLGDGDWDVIHFNFGIWDTKINPATGLPYTSHEDYVQHLQTIAQRLQATGATVIFATTTPIPDVLLTVPEAHPLPPQTRLFEAVTDKNRLALQAMQKRGVRINDLYAAIYPDREKYWRKDDLHFTLEGSQVLAQAVAASIEAALTGPPPSP